MTSPLETKARALGAAVVQRLYAGGFIEATPEPGDEDGLLPLLLTFASEVERDATEQACAAICEGCRMEKVIVRHVLDNDYAHVWSVDGSTQNIRGCAAAAIRSLSEPPAETPEPKG